MGGLVVVVVLVALLAGCSGGSKNTTTATVTPPPPVTLKPLRVYFLLHGKVQGVRRMVPASANSTDAALTALVRGPSRPETDLGLSSGVPTAAVWSTGRTSDGVLSVDFGPLERAGLAQVVYTVTQSPAVKTVELDGKRYTRADFEDETPTILVESPLPFQTVKSPLRATGTANTFEATFQYDLVDSSGKLVKTHFVTATSGTGTRGTFDFAVPFPAAPAGLGKLVVYELSAKDGSRIHTVEIPVRLTG